MDTAISTGSINRWLLFLFLFIIVPLSSAAEVIRPIAAPQTSLTLGGVAELHDDVYSADVSWSAEVALCDCFSVYTDMSYRFVSYEWDTMLHDQIHEMVNLQVNGLNESYVGLKIFPVEFFGVDVSWRFPPGDGSQENRFQRLGVEPMGLYEFSPNMFLGLSGQYYSFLEDKNFQPGDELGLKGSIVWNLRLSKRKIPDLGLSYVFLYRLRIQESENRNLAEPYQKMDDKYQGFRMRVGLLRNLNSADFPVILGVNYEMNRGTLFGFETGHKLELYLRFELP